MTESEIWKDVVGYDGRYKVSNKGNVYSVDRRSAIGRKCGGRMLNPTRNKDGYPQVCLCKNGIRKHKSVHRLVAETFIPNPKSFSEVNHLDEIKDNNCVENLEWCDPKYNVNYGTRNEKVRQKLSKRIKAVNIETGEVTVFKSTREAGRKGYTQEYVSSACRGVYRSGSAGKLIGDGHTYRGYRWFYERKESKI